MSIRGDLLPPSLLPPGLLPPERRPGSIAPRHQPFPTGKALPLLEKARIANRLGRISLALSRSRETEEVSFSRVGYVC